MSPIVDANPAANFFWWTRENDSYFRYNGSVLRINKIHKTSSGNYSYYVVNTITPSGMDPFNVTMQKKFYVDVQCEFKLKFKLVEFVEIIANSCIEILQIEF